MIGRQKGGTFGVAFTIPDSFNCEQAKNERAPLGNEFDAPSGRSGSARDAVAHTIRFQAVEKSAFAAITGLPQIHLLQSIANFREAGV